MSNSGFENFGYIAAEITPEEYDIRCSRLRRAAGAQQASMHLSEGSRLVMLRSISVSAKGVKSHALHPGSKNTVEALSRYW